MTQHDFRLATWATAGMQETNKHCLCLHKSEEMEIGWHRDTWPATSRAGIRRHIGTRIVDVVEVAESTKDTKPAATTAASCSWAAAAASIAPETTCVW
eukprot:CAMPEP_0195020780 /NCGR_PEP_ID=MMETSP0326_2-20130528/36192_1 /TAXON_ID=2866 ORGANISM="Crypthecodinium cohnii, Strain Seligo" /NCGR_SAMPLE_ID=MMETSP0326_2 /ASSEMBLY_ACC=CAM_ASM_000348 /LENGTH=97 /DNA_ID=CAMNT_0040039613 /DNA_START=47 /DNA_END=341 /DNA_ORIENTATION=+